VTPQSTFMVVAPVVAARMAELRALLAGMTAPPGTGNADPGNDLVPFGRFETLHFARFVVLEDSTPDDVRLYGLQPPKLPVYMAFLGDFDGPYDAFVTDLLRIAAEGLRKIFGCCEGFSAGADLETWIRTHEKRPAAAYCNWVGRTARQCREEAALRAALVEYLGDHPDLRDAGAPQARRDLRRFVDAEVHAGRLTLTAPVSTPLRWSVDHCADASLFVAVLVGLVAALPVTLPLGIVAALYLRHLEETDPEVTARPTPEYESKLSALEDHGVTNSFSAFGTVKPGKFRAALLRAALFFIGLAARLLYTRGRLARVHTIHFARWVYLDDGARVFFASNYDGSLESYMDDFINRVSFGLNAVFGNGIGYPRTAWLVAKGAKNEETFKNFLRRHQLPTDVWYAAYPGCTTVDLERNSRVREGLYSNYLGQEEAARWLALL
jgi:hypothetical protein